MYVVLVTTRTKNHALLKESFSLERLSLILRLPDSRWKPAMLTYDPHCSPLLWVFFIVLLIQCNTHCDTIPRFSLSRPKDLWLSPLMAAFWRRKNRHYLFFRTCSVGCIFHISFCHDKCGFLLGFFHGQIVWNLFIVGKLVEKKAASEMISFIAFFPSNLIPVPGLLFNAHMKC